MNIPFLKITFDDGTYPEDFWGWLADNEHILRAFLELALRTRRAGVKRWSADAVCHVLRWETAIRESGQSHVKINDHATAGLARLAREIEPELKNFFTVRTPPAREHARRLRDGRLYPETEESIIP